MRLGMLIYLAMGASPEDENTTRMTIAKGRSPSLSIRIPEDRTDSLKTLALDLARESPGSN